MPVNYASRFSPEVFALLAAAEESAARRADDLDARGAKIAVLNENGLGSTLQSAKDELHVPRVLPKMAPPKRFYRILWQSVSQRLLQQWGST